MREAHDCNFRPDLGMGCINSRCPGHRAMRTLGENLRIAGFGAAMFKAGDNFGFHMGEDSSQCTCQWSPGSGVPYDGPTRCESDCDDSDYSARVAVLDDDSDYDGLPPGPNGCVCGFNGDCNCPFVESP